MAPTAIRIGGDLEVGRIGYGAMRLTGPNLWGDYPGRDGGIALLRQAVEAGVSLIDTADVYGPHTNELLIQQARGPVSDQSASESHHAAPWSRLQPPRSELVRRDPPVRVRRWAR